MVPTLMENPKSSGKGDDEHWEKFRQPFGGGPDPIYQGAPGPIPFDPKLIFANSSSR